MSASAAPVAVFGFDAADAPLVERGLAEGWLPTLRRLAAEGGSALLDPPPSGFYNTSWIATVTGRDVFEHRCVLDRELEPGTYRILDRHPDAIRARPFWAHLSDAGLRSTVASIYSAPTVPGLLGTQVHGWGAIDPFTAKFGTRIFDPPETERLLARAVPSRQQLYRTEAPTSAAGYRAYRDRLLASVEEQTRGLAALLRETRWDFFFGSYGEPHHGGHLLWHLADPSHDAHDPALAAAVGETITAVYAAVDAGIGRLLELVPTGTRCFVLTPHGMQPSYVDEPAEEILEACGFLARRAPGSAGTAARTLDAGFRLARALVPTGVRLAIRARLPGDGLVAERPLAHVDWARTRAFALPSDMTSAIRVNLAGREPQGTVGPGEYEALCDELEGLFTGLRHAASGAPAVERVVRPAAVLGGPPRDSLPDLCVVWADTEPVRRLEVPGIGSRSVAFADPRTGQHRHVGFLTGAGPGIAAAGTPGLGTVGGSLLDVGPTMLALLGVDAPLPGRPLERFLGGRGAGALRS
jgi:predicted AlkP superfamily phosphohydrolase/phosphomutase